MIGFWKIGQIVGLTFERENRVDYDSLSHTQVKSGVILTTVEHQYMKF